MKLFPISPILLLLFSGGGLSLAQIVLANKSFSGFWILNQTPSATLPYLYILFAVSAAIGFALGTPLLAKNAECSPLPISSIHQSKLKRHLNNALAINFTIIAISQYFMGSANVLQIISGNVSAQDIEEILKNSPFGIHGIKLIAGFYAIILHRACHISGIKGSRIAILHAQAVFIFLSSAKIGGMLFWAASLLSLNTTNWKSFLKLTFASVLIIILFVVTRVIRNPGMELTALGDFVLNFVFGLYLGSPVVNTNFMLIHPEYTGSFVFLFSHFLPHKLLPVTLLDLMKSFPDPTSPLGLVGAAFGFLSYIGVLLVGIVCGFLAHKLNPKSNRNITRILFLPFLIVSCAFSVMYQHFFNLTFFWIPLIMAAYVSRRFFPYV